MEITECRKDGWPLCPNCNEDELYCPYIVDFYNENGRVPTLEECFKIGFRCYRCQQEIKPKNLQLD